MVRQLEKGKQHPMRPITSTYDMAAADVFPDQSGGKDWTAADTQMTPRGKTIVMDDNSRISVATTDITLPPGIWKARVECIVTNTGAGTDDFAVALTNSDGTVVHHETPQLTLLAGQAIAVVFSHILHFTANTVINLRGTQLTAGTNIQMEPEHILFIEKIGNANES
jgi:hypothetical protein